MFSEPPDAIKIFFSYAHEDESLRDELAKQLSLLKRMGHIEEWYDRRIVSGSDWAFAIDKHLNEAHIILLLVSADFIASDYCYGVELKRALERHETGEALVIPILLRAIDWADSPFSKLQALPTDVRPVTSWSNQDEAFADIVKGIRAAVKELRPGQNTFQHQQPSETVEPNIPQPVAPRYVESIKRILGGVNFTESVVTKSYHLSSSSPPPLPDKLRRRPLETLFYCLDILAQMACRVPDSAPLLAFLVRLLPHVDQGATRDRVEEYIDTVGAELRVDIDLIRRKVAEKDEAFAVEAAREPRLLVKIARDTSVLDRFYVVGWVQHGPEYKKLDSEGSVVKDDLPAFFKRLVEECGEFLESLFGEMGDVFKRLAVEVFLPVDLLDCGLESWDVPAGIESLTCPLGILYEVVVRSWERTYHHRSRMLKSRWLEKWQTRPRSLPEMTDEHVYWAFSEGDLEKQRLLKKLLASGHVFLTLTPICGGDRDAAGVFRSIIAAGTPIALWPRKPPADVSAAHKEVRALVYKHELDTLPYKIYKRREAAASAARDDLIWNFVTLMWDDPDRQPPDVDKRLGAP